VLGHLELTPKRQQPPSRASREGVHLSPSPSVPLTLAPAPQVLILAVVYVFYTVLLPLRHPITTVPGALHATLGFTLIINILFNYLSCIFTNPGEPPAVLVRASPYEF
jgi:uncharacterized BrkB/YihY/UPF0761 family membrane protein